MAITRTVGYGDERRVETIGVGSTVGTVIRTVRVMSDIWDDIHYAIYVDPVEGIREVSCERDAVVLDATPEALDLAAALSARDAVSLARGRYDARTDEILHEAGVVERGTRVVVARGRKVPKGTAGEVFWVGSTRWGWRVGFTPDGVENDGNNGTFTALSNVDVEPDLKAARVAAVEAERDPFDAAAEEAAAVEGFESTKRWLEGFTAENTELRTYRSRASGNTAALATAA